MLCGKSGLKFSTGVRHRSRYRAVQANAGVLSPRRRARTGTGEQTEVTMVAELNILTEWLPEQMEPGSIFVLENAGEVGDQDDPYWAVLSCPECGTLGLITRRQMRGVVP